MTSTDEVNWSAPDNDGIRTCFLDVGAKVTLRGRRKRRSDMVRTDVAALWLPQWRDLLRDWVKQGGERRAWDALLKKAGGNRAHDAWQLLDELLKAGLVELEEKRQNGRWQPIWVDFPEMEILRELCGLTNRDALRRIRMEQESGSFNNSILKPLVTSLTQMPVERAVRRHTLLAALDTWISECRNGTQRDFALFAVGDTKGISNAEWDWFESGLAGLEEMGISRHTPAIWLRAPITLLFKQGRIDLHAVPDCIALTPATLECLAGCEGQLERWLILENRTVFERVARSAPAATGVIWVPGFAPTWWKQAVKNLIIACPASAFISCDPDPSGIEIALGVGCVFLENALTWEPWYMDSTTLSGLQRRKQLVPGDREHIQLLLDKELPETLKELAEYMLSRDEKGEQEGVTYEF